MKSFILIIQIFFVAVFSCFLAANYSRAQESTSISSRSLQAFEGLKKRIVILMNENNLLEVEYALLQKEYSNLSKRYQKYAGKIEELKFERKREAQVINERRERLQYLQAELPDTESNKLILDSRVAYANRQLIDMDDILQMLKLKISSLEFESRDIEMAKKIAEYNSIELENQQNQRIQELKNAYEENVKREKELLMDIERMEEKGQRSDFEINQLKTRNEELSLRIEQAIMQIAMQKDKNELLRKKKLYEVRLSENKIWQYDQEKVTLEKSVALLDEKADRLGQKIELSRTNQKQKREILDSIMRIDKKNQNLKDKISELQQKMKDMK